MREAGSLRIASTFQRTLDRHLSMFRRKTPSTPIATREFGAMRTRPASQPLGMLPFCPRTLPSFATALSRLPFERAL